MFTNERLARLAVSSMAAVMGGIVLLGLCGNPVGAAASWLLYTIVCAILLNSREGDDFRVLARLAILPAVIPLLVLAYPVLFLNEKVCFSGIVLVNKAFGAIGGLCLFFFGASYCAITLFAFGRTKVLAAVAESSTPAMTERIKQIEGAVRRLTALAGSISLLYLAITSSR